jgi:hypothetical protein
VICIAPGLIVGLVGRYTQVERGCSPAGVAGPFRLRLSVGVRVRVGVGISLRVRISVGSIVQEPDGVVVENEPGSIHPATADIQETDADQQCPPSVSVASG